MVYQNITVHFLAIVIGSVSSIVIDGGGGSGSSSKRKLNCV